MRHYLIIPLIFILTACNLGATPPVAQPTSTQTVAATATHTPPPTETPAPTSTFTPTPTETSTPTLTPIPVVESLKATVKELLSCRYGPGAEYLYLYGLNKGANIKIIGRTGGNNWVMVEGKNKCWVNAKFIEIEGDPQTLKVVYPSDYKLPVSPYYSAPTVYSAKRDGNNVTVNWSEVVLRAGDEEDDSMFIYIIEVWRCEGGKIIFDPLASNYPEVTFVDEPGCEVPSHGRVFFQEKHGFAGPAEISMPPHDLK
jgi:uncharacterized protein YraI